MDLADELAKRTRDAYSAPAYENREWFLCCEGLLQRGVGITEAEIVLRSKWTRWSRDDSVNRNGTAAEFLAYFDRQSLGHYFSLINEA